ncbi:MAG: leucyl/phenylalanyl-tRNA--protein transferase [Verrucomicrobiales bacterium]
MSAGPLNPQEPQIPILPKELLLRAYSNGIFPMAMHDGEIGWFSPDPRAILPLDSAHWPHGLRRTLKKNLFEIRYNTAFEKVLLGCAAREETWIDPVIFRSYVALHHDGHAHSVECWQNNKLVGGLYGVQVGGVFCGESMFHTATDASKVALHALVTRLVERQFHLLDVQWSTSHLQTFGVIEISREEYMRRLKEALLLSRRFP